MRPRVALVTLTETRPDFRARRESLVAEEMAAVRWLSDQADVWESGPVASGRELRALAREILAFGADALVVHIPIWTEPVLTVKLTGLLPLPVLLLGNDRPETSSTVGMLGAGGALDQVGRPHERVLGHTTAEARRRVMAFLRAAAVRGALRGQTLGMFGGRSLGILTATADPAQWHRLFGVDIEHVDQMAIVERARALDQSEVAGASSWFTGRLGQVEYGGSFTAEALDRQVRSYLATRAVVAEKGFDFVAVKCQPELTDGYASQCVAHTLMNGTVDAGGEKALVVHACEADADGALTMQILHLLSGGRSAALLDVRLYDAGTGLWTMANCGAIPAAFTATAEDPTGLSGLHMQPHVFGKGGGGALPGVVQPQVVTLARLCRKQGEYWLAIVSGLVQQGDRSDLARTTAAFPHAFIKTAAGAEFLGEFGSNHIHMVAGDVVQELTAFCRILGIPWRYWA
ncbi:MAG TPA: hypothetical protein VD969_10765 [Symbiobacteriaceae bacterium]|nr:hypothetical protein [Symbiobacteriaceae bacterium]